MHNAQDICQSRIKMKVFWLQKLGPLLFSFDWSKYIKVFNRFFSKMPFYAYSNREKIAMEKMTF